MQRKHNKYNSEAELKSVFRQIVATEYWKNFQYWYNRIVGIITI